MKQHVLLVVDVHVLVNDKPGDEKDEVRIIPIGVTDGLFTELTDDGQAGLIERLQRRVGDGAGDVVVAGEQAAGCQRQGVRGRLERVVEHLGHCPRGVLVAQIAHSF